MWIIFFNKCIEIFSVLFPFFIVKCVLADVFVYWLINLLIKCILVYIPLKNISFIWRCYYCREELQIWAFARRLTKDLEQGVIFIVPHPLWSTLFFILFLILFFAFFCFLLLRATAFYNKHGPENPDPYSTVFGEETCNIIIAEMK